MQSKISVINGGRNKHRVTKTNKRKQPCLSFLCAETGRKYEYILKPDHILINTHIEPNISLLPRCIAPSEFEGLVVLVEEKALPNVALALWLKDSEEFINLCSSADLHYVLLLWRSLSSYYNLPMYLRNKDNSLVYVKGTDPQESLSNYNNLLKLSAYIEEKLKNLLP